MNTAHATVVVSLQDRSYPIHIGRSLLPSLGSLLAAAGLRGRALIVSNPVIIEAFGEVVGDSLAAAGIDSMVHPVAPGEASKRLSTVEAVCDAGIAFGLDRQGTVIALGGGVVGDLTGLAAALLLRGVAFVQVPTSLAAMVDSSVGGKTGVNSALGKNLIGAFWQPRLVAADLDTLATLPPREMRCGMAEVIKHGCILDADLFVRLERELVPGSRGPFELTAEVRMSEALVTCIVRRSCELKAAVVADDETETDRRMWLNYGHTFGHALEQVCGYGALNHGEAISIGMALAARLDVLRGALPAEHGRRIAHLLGAAGLPTAWPSGTDPQAVYEAMWRDKKVSGGTLRLTLLRRLGEAVVTGDVPPDTVRDLLVAASRETGDGAG